MIKSDALISKLDECERKAWDSLARYKFEMFGYWSSRWVGYNQLAYDMGIIPKKRANAFKSLVKLAQAHNEILNNQGEK